MVVMFYSLVVQVVLLVGSVYWVLSTATGIIAEGTHTGFLQKITGKLERWSTYRMSVTQAL